MDRSRKQQITNWYMEYVDGIYSFLTYYTRRKDVEDLVQEVFVRAIKSFDTYTGTAQPKTWLYSIARNVAIDDMRRRRLFQWLPEDWLNSHRSSDPSPEEAAFTNEQTRELYTSISRLKPSYRDVLILRGMKDFTVTETAEILDWSESKVKVTLSRAIKALQKIHPTERGNEHDESE